jgi:ribosomal protein L7Ae-like RNA K-turn-binding protein
MPDKIEMEQTMAEAQVKQKLLTMAGFAMRAGKLICGTDKICDEIRRHGLPDDGENSDFHVTGIVLLACDASENTKKRIANACHYYHVELVNTPLTSEEIASRIGRAAAAACATFDKGFVDGMKKAVGLTRENRRKRV